MHRPFNFTPPASEKAANFLAARAKHLATLKPSAQVVFLKWSLLLARQLPISADVSAVARLHVIITLQRWLDEVTEAA